MFSVNVTGSIACGFRVVPPAGLSEQNMDRLYRVLSGADARQLITRLPMLGEDGFMARGNLVNTLGLQGLGSDTVCERVAKWLDDELGSTR